VAYEQLLTLLELMGRLRFSEVRVAQSLVSFATLYGPMFVCPFWIGGFLLRI